MFQKYKSAIIVVIIFILWGLVGKWDYQDERRAYCEAYLMTYDVDRDECK